MILSFLKSKWWHLFAAFYMVSIIAYTVTSYVVGWTGTDPLHLLIIIACQIVLAFILWLVFYLHYRKEISTMNRRLQEMK